MMRLDLLRSLPGRTDNAVLAFLVPKDDRQRALALRRIHEVVPLPAPVRRGKDFEGKEEETLLLYTDRGGRPQRIILAGLGEFAKRSEPSNRSINLERFRAASAAAAKRAAQANSTAKTLVISVPGGIGGKEKFPSSEEILVGVFEGAALGLYRFDRYLSEKKGKTKLTTIALHPDGFDPGNALKRARVIVSSVTFARDLANAPANEVYPASFAYRVKKTGRKSGFRVTVFDEKKISTLGMGGILAVSAGAREWHPPRFIILEYRGPRPVNEKPVVIVGKGVTFDSGGISLKPSANMAEMKMDMSGAAAVAGTFKAAAELRLPVHLVGVVPLTENMPGGSATKPGDIIRISDGQTVEVDNTDAEGRLILADALSYIRKRYPRGVEAVIDLATLTGACVVALGQYATGMLGTNRKVLDELKKAGEETYERVWELPLYKEYDHLVKSDVADVKNAGGRWAGAITAACFLKKFAGNMPWVHLDIAGTAILEEAAPYAPKGGSGVGVRLLVQYLQNRVGRKNA